MPDTHPITVAIAPQAMEKLKARVGELKFADVETYLLYLISIDLAEDKAYAADLMKKIYQAEAMPGRMMDAAAMADFRERMTRVINDAAASAKRAAG